MKFIYYVSNNLESAVPEKPIRELTEPLTTTEPSAGKIDVNTAERHQTMAGIGAAFSEIGTLAWATLPADQQQTLLRALFNTKDGAGLSFCRPARRFQRFRHQRLLLFRSAGRL